MRWMMTVIIYGIFSALILAPLAALLNECRVIGWPAVQYALGRPEALFALTITVKITIFVVCINTVMGVILALMIVKDRLPGRNIWLAVINAPFAVSPVIAGLMLVLTYGPHTMLGLFLDQLGVKVVFALPGMVLATLFVTLPFVVQELIPVMEAAGKDQEEAAQTLGAGGWTVFWRITLPPLTSSLCYGACMTAARSMGEFGAVLVVSGNLIMQTQTATLFAYQAVADFDLTSAYAVSFLLIMLSFAAMLTMQILDRGREVVHQWK